MLVSTVDRTRRARAVESLRESFYPEIRAGGFSRLDGTVDFYTRINALLTPDMVVVDLGAGRGEWLEDTVSFRRDLRRLRGKVRRVVGVDVDPVVKENAGCDEALVISDLERIDLPNASVDLIVSDHTFEHVDRPERLVAEIDRILRPGGWMCARTPNKWGYIGVGARLVPNGAHARTLHRLQPGRQDQDVFPVRYKLNTLGNLRRYFPAHRFQISAYTVNAEPTYVGAYRPAWWAMKLMGTLLPQVLGAKYMIFIRKL